MRKVTVGLVQTHNPVSDPKASISKVQKAAMAATLPFVHEAGKKGVQILGLQEIFNGRTSARLRIPAGTTPPSPCRAHDRGDREDREEVPHGRRRARLRA